MHVFRETTTTYPARTTIITLSCSINSPLLVREISRPCCRKRRVINTLDDAKYVL